LRSQIILDLFKIVSREFMVALGDVMVSRALLAEVLSDICEPPVLGRRANNAAAQKFRR
jgi:hypothetical protein